MTKQHILYYVRKQINYRDYLRKKALKTKSTYFHNAYKKARNKVNKVIKNSKQKYFQNYIDGNRGNAKKNVEWHKSIPRQGI